MDNQTEPTVVIAEQSVPFYRNKFFYFILAFVAVACLGTAFFLKDKLYPKIKETATADNVVAKVGRELIYRQDVEEISSFLPPMPEPEKTKAALGQAVAESIILQGAGEDRLIKLDSVELQSPKKDYAKRTELLKQTRALINSQASSMSGTVVGIWFYDPAGGPVREEPYNRGKEIARSKISQLQQQVKSGRITIEQAGDLIKQDTTLAQIDPAFKNHAIFSFKAERGQPITLDPVFDDILWRLTEGEVSDIYPAKNIEMSDTRVLTGRQVEAIYMFGVIGQKSTAGRFDSFNSWLAQKKKIYEVKYL